MAEFERDIGRERTSGGIAGRARTEGKPWGEPGYAYRQGPDGHWQVEPVEAAIARRIYALMVEGGQTYDGIAKVLNREGVKTRHGSRWTATVVRRLLTSRHVLGFYWHDGEWHEGQHAVVDPATWEAAQALAERSRVYAPKEGSGHIPTNHVFVRGALRCQLYADRARRARRGDSPGSTGTLRPGLRHRRPERSQLRTTDRLVHGRATSRDGELERLSAHAEQVGAATAGLDDVGEALRRLASLREGVAKQVIASKSDVGALRAAMAQVFECVSVLDDNGKLYVIPWLRRDAYDGFISTPLSELEETPATLPIPRVPMPFDVSENQETTRPLPKKLGIKPGSRLLLVDAPDGFALEDLPDGVTEADGEADVILAFHTSRDELAQRMPALRERMDKAAGLWIAWPKRASKLETDLTEDVVRELALANTLVDNKVCAIDETWSGLRLVIRLRDR